MPKEKTNGSRIIIAAVTGLVVLIAGWVMALHMAQASTAKEASANSARIDSVEQNIKEIKQTQQLIYQEVLRINRGR